MPIDRGYESEIKNLFNQIISSIPYSEPIDPIAAHYKIDHEYISQLVSDFEPLLTQKRYILIGAILRMITDRVIEDCWIANDPEKSIAQIALRENRLFIKNIGDIIQHANQTAQHFSGDEEHQQQKDHAENVVSAILARWPNLADAPNTRDMANSAIFDNDSLSWLYSKSFRYFSSAIHFNPQSLFSFLNYDYDPIANAYLFKSISIRTDDETRYILHALLFIFCSATISVFHLDMNYRLECVKCGLNHANNELYQRVIRFEINL